MVDVYFLDLRKKKRENFLERLRSFLHNSSLLNFINNREMVGIKVHFGEDGNINYVRPEYVRLIGQQVEKAGGRPFLTDTTTLYGGRRFDGPSHLALAREHGFDFYPVMIADGLIGENYVEKDGVKIAGAIDHTESLIFISHFKGHLLIGFGGSLKNIGMGCTSKGGKLYLHSESKPFIDKEKCNFCLKCLKYCSFNAIFKEKKHCVIDEKRCAGCCGCMSICPEKAISFRWDSESKHIQEKIAGYAHTIVKNKKVLYFNFLINITRDCDCFHTREPKLTEDIGILIAQDPVALDQASWDMTREVLGRVYSEIDPEIQLFEAEHLGLGKRSYKIKEAD